LLKATDKKAVTAKTGMIKMIRMILFKVSFMLPVWG
jgi:hypothetical protein